MMFKKSNGKSSEQSNTPANETSHTYTGSGHSFGRAAIIVAVIAVLVAIANSMGVWGTIFPSVVQQPWFTALSAHLPAGILLIGVSFAWISCKIDSGIWTRIGAWGVGIAGYFLYLFLAEIVIMPLSEFLATWIPAQYALSATTLLFWSVMVIGLSKCIGRFVLKTKVGLSPNIVAFGVIAVLVLIILGGIGPNAFYDTIYAIMPPETADKFMAMLGSIGTAASTVDVATITAPVAQDNSTMMLLITQVIAAALKYLPQWLVSVVFMHAYAPRGNTK